MIFRKLVFPVAFSDRCRGAAPYVRAFANRFASEVELLHVIEAQYAVVGAPELAMLSDSETTAELLRQATLLGVYVLAAQATGHPAHGGYQPGELVALLKYRVLPAIDCLFEQGAYPTLYRTREVAAAPPPAFEVTGSDTLSTEIIQDAAAFLGELGTEFMGD